jgi:hypothetical protein
MASTRVVVRLALTIAFVTTAVAQQSPVPATSPVKTEQPHPEMAKLINAMVGTWATDLTFEPSERYPKGAAGQGKQVWRSGPGGMSLIEDETASTPSGSWDGMSVTWWDNEGHGFRAIWCDNRQPNGCVVMQKLARWEGNEFVLGDEWIRGGKKIVFKEVCSELTPNSFTLTTYVGESDQELKKTLTVRANRVGGRP